MKGDEVLARPTGCRLLRSAYFLLTALLVGLLPFTAAANSAPPRTLGDTGGPLLPGTSDQVHVLSERLSFELEPDFQAARVTARYELENRGGDLAGQPFVFVIQAAADDLDVTATWLGAAVPVEEVDPAQFSPAEVQEMESAWTTVDTWIDPVSGEPYGDREWFGSVGLRYYRFAVDLPAGAAGELQVAYTQSGARDRTLHAHPVYHYQYLLLPARGWASFGPLEIRVSALAWAHYYFASNLDFRQENGQYVANYQGLPEENLAFAVMDRSGILFGLTQPGPYYWMGFAILLALAGAIGAGIGWAAGFIPHRGWAIAAGALAGLLLGGFLDLLLAVVVLQTFPPLRSQSYGLYLVGIGQGLAGAVLTAVVAGWFARRRAAGR